MRDPFLRVLVVKVIVLLGMEAALKTSTFSLIVTNHAPSKMCWVATEMRHRFGWHQEQSGHKAEEHMDWSNMKQ